MAPGDTPLPRLESSWPAGFAVLAVVCLAILVATLPRAAGPPSDHPSAARGAETRGTRDAFARLPLAFVPNRGQTDARVQYEARAGGFHLFLTKRNVVLALAKGRQGRALEIGFTGANANPAIEPLGRRRG